jgi:hypothetical protein
VFAENGVGQQRGSWFHEEHYSSGADHRLLWSANRPAGQLPGEEGCEAEDRFAIRAVESTLTVM